MRIDFNEYDIEKIIKEYYWLHNKILLILLIICIIFGCYNMPFGLYYNDKESIHYGVDSLSFAALFFISMICRYFLVKKKLLNFYKIHSENNLLSCFLGRENDIFKFEYLNTGSIIVFKKNLIKKIDYTKNFLFIIFYGSSCIILPNNDEIKSFISILLDNEEN